MPLAVQIQILEFERGWGSRVDDYMVCLSIEDAIQFSTEFNSKNTEAITPDWYMVAATEPEPIDISQAQYDYLQINQRVWFSDLRKL